mmetsp:Transcript_3368/g.12021  ORF Transcript_3368/g.12021 Transcript_3368/m.12021 type:complete len:225 (+) Transcript_3368:216-890(+)
MATPPETRAAAVATASTDVARPSPYSNQRPVSAPMTMDCDGKSLSGITNGGGPTGTGSGSTLFFLPFLSFFFVDEGSFFFVGESFVDLVGDLAGDLADALVADLAGDAAESASACFEASSAAATAAVGGVFTSSLTQSGVSDETSWSRGSVLSTRSTTAVAAAQSSRRSCTPMSITRSGRFKRGCDAMRTPVKCFAANPQTLSGRACMTAVTRPLMRRSSSGLA